MKTIKRLLIVFLITLSFSKTAAPQSPSVANTIEDIAEGFLLGISGDFPARILTDDGHVISPALSDEIQMTYRELARGVGLLTQLEVLLRCAPLRHPIWDEHVTTYFQTEVMDTVNPLTTSQFQRYLQSAFTDSLQFAVRNSDTTEGFLGSLAGAIVREREFVRVASALASELGEAAESSGCGEKAYIMHVNAILFAWGQPPVDLESVKAVSELRLQANDTRAWSPEILGAWQEPAFSHPGVERRYKPLVADKLQGQDIGVCTYETSDGRTFRMFDSSTFPRLVGPQDENLIAFVHRGLSYGLAASLGCGRSPEFRPHDIDYWSRVVAIGEVARVLKDQIE